MRTQTLIMAVPWLTERAKGAVELAAQTAGTIVWDQKQDAFDTWRRVLEAAGEDAAVIIEDDVELTSGWQVKVDEVIAMRPDDVIQFFSLPRQRNAEGPHWEPGRTFLMNQCYYLPDGAAIELLEFTASWVEENPRYRTGYDVAMARWMQTTKRSYWQHVPSLVQHRDWQSQINPKRPRKRQSETFRP